MMAVLIWGGWQGGSKRTAVGGSACRRGVVLVGESRISEGRPASAEGAGLLGVWPQAWHLPVLRPDSEYDTNRNLDLYKTLVIQ